LTPNGLFADAVGQCILTAAPVPPPPLA